MLPRGDCRETSLKQSCDGHLRGRDDNLVNNCRSKGWVTCSTAGEPYRLTAAREEWRECGASAKSHRACWAVMVNKSLNDQEHEQMCQTMSVKAEWLRSQHSKLLTWSLTCLSFCCLIPSYVVCWLKSHWTQAVQWHLSTSFSKLVHDWIKWSSQHGKELDSSVTVDHFHAYATPIYPPPPFFLFPAWECHKC